MPKHVTTDYVRGLVMTAGQEAAGVAEKQQQINIARAAAQIPSLKHYVMSSLPPASLSSGGKLPVPHFDFKHAAFQWIDESLPELATKTTRIWLGWYPTNMAFNPIMKFVPVVGFRRILMPQIVGRATLTLCRYHSLAPTPMHGSNLVDGRLFFL